MESKEKFGKVRFPGWLFLILTVVYNELLLHFWITEQIQPGRLLVVLAFALGFGGILALLTSMISSEKAVKWVSIGLAVIVAVIWLMEYFISDAYKTFMTPATIFSGAGGVAKDYLDLVLSLLGRSFWRIVVALVPTVLYALFFHPGTIGWKSRGILAAFCMIAYLLGIAAVTHLTGNAGRLGMAYEFDSAVRSFGLSMGLALEATHSSSGEKELSFVEMPPETTVSVPQSTQTQDVPEATQPTVAYGDNVLAQLDYGALAESAGNSTVASIYSYVASQTPSKQNEYTGAFAGKNLILITAEAFTEEVIDPERTPTLYRMANEGIRFTDYYQPAWGASTTSGEFSNLTGIVPTNGGMCMKETLQQDLFLTMGHQLRKLGYYSVAYHNHNKNFYDRDKTHTHLGYDQFLAQYGGLEGITPVWPESDLEMIDVSVPQYIDRQPFSIYYMTVSGHCMYSQEENAMTRKHYDEVADMDCGEAVKCYHACQLELEAAMASLIRQLEEAGIADDTVVVLTTDHYPYGLERSSTWQNTSDYLAELYGVDICDKFTRDHNALIIWSECLEGRNITVDEPVFSLDILPTLSNLFGLEYDSRLLVGRDVFSGKEPLVFWMDYSWKTDKGRYDAQRGEFTPAEGVTVEDGYVDRISSQVANKITYSRSVLETDFFNYVSDALKQGE